MTSDFGKTVRRTLFNYKESFEYFLVYLSLKNKTKIKKPAKVIFYPNLPGPRHIMGRIFRIMQFQISNKLDEVKQASFVVNWEDTTFRTYFPELENLYASGWQVININCRDISKRRVDEVFGKVFGYTTFIDPTRFNGVCVQKGDVNALHNGRTVNCPIEKAEPGYIYQRLINNQINNQYVEDIRVPVYKNIIPYVYIKNRPIEDRFGSKNASCVIKETAQVFTQQEINNIITFCNDFGLDAGELDILRDRNDGKIYIVDVNNTPGGPPNSLSKFDQLRAMHLFTTAFIDQFEKSPTPQTASSVNKKA